MRRIIWTGWAVLFGLVFALIFVTKFSELFGHHGIPFAWLVLTGVGCIACLKVARAERHADLELLVAEIEAGPLANGD